MALPTVDEFIGLLETESLPSIVETYVFKAEPFAFQENPEAYEQMKANLVERLSVRPENITIVGSAKLGFSLSPDTRFRRFSASSDIDVAVVSKELFDRMWSIILEWHNPRRSEHLPVAERDWVVNSRRRIYWGTLRPRELKYSGVAFPEKLRPLRDLTTAWFNAFKELSRLAVFDERETSGYLYRTWWHANLYHTAGLIQIRSQVRETS